MSVMHSGTEPPVSGTKSFEDEVRVVLLRLRNALSELIAHVPDVIRRPADLQRALNLDATLAWQVYRMANAVNPLRVPDHLPGPAAMARVLRCASDAGIADSAVEAVGRAHSDVKRLIQYHAGDRASFDTMLGGLAAGDGYESIDLKHLRAAFRANCHIWGMCSETFLSCLLIAPSATKGCVDLVVLRGELGLRRLRRSASIVLLREWVPVTSENRPAVQRWEPFDPSAPRVGNAELLEEFCSRPLPEFTTHTLDNQSIQVGLANRGIGLTSKVDCFLASKLTGLHSPLTESVPEFISNLLVRKPTEVGIQDVLILDPQLEMFQPEMFVYGDEHVGDTVVERSRTERLPLRAEAVFLGRDPAVLHTPDVPRYPEIVRHLIERMGWPQEFAAYRARVQYPPMSSTMQMRFTAPSESGSD